MKARPWKGGSCSHCFGGHVVDGVATCCGCGATKPASELPELPGHAEGCATRWEPPGMCACGGYKAPKPARARR